MLSEIEDIIPNLAGTIEIAGKGGEFVTQRAAHCNDFAGRRDNAALADQIAPFFAPRLGDADHPNPILIGSRLHDEVVVEALQMVVFRRRRVVRWRIVADQNHLRAAQCPPPAAGKRAVS